MSWESKGAPPMPPALENKAVLLRDDQGTMMINDSLPPYFLEGVGIGGPLRFLLTWVDLHFLKVTLTEM